MLEDLEDLTNNISVFVKAYIKAINKFREIFIL